MPKIIVLHDGYSRMSENEPDVMEANCTCTLIKCGTELEPKNVIVDSMTPWDRDFIIEKLKSEHDLTPEQISHVVSTHGHSDHVGNTHY